jgi:hypothetical protein
MTHNIRARCIEKQQENCRLCKIAHNEDEICDRLARTTAFILLLSERPSLSNLRAVELYKLHHTKGNLVP